MASTISTTQAGDTKPKLNTSANSHPSADSPPRTPTATAVSAHALYSEIRSIYQDLTQLSDLKPGPDINSLLTRLVGLCVEPYSKEFVNYFLNIDGITELCENLRPICASAEGELEKHWSQVITKESICTEASPTQTKSLLSMFPYLQNYADLSRIECLTLESFLSTPSLSHRPHPQKIAFIGSGPLPLTSLCITEIYPHATVHNVDRDADALRVSQELCTRLGCGARMTFSCEDVSCIGDGGGEAEGTQWGEFDVVFLAALVGMDTRTKLGILSALGRRLSKGTLVVARSAMGLRAVLYPVLEISEWLEGTGLEMLVEVHPWTKVVNSVIVLRVL